ncbi:MAG: GIY-YIG nuclease family protein [Desulfurococcales archaeon]|nr:GIY-YIG nuclease family protein [Desulfurococcales archaeon]
MLGVEMPGEGCRGTYLLLLKTEGQALVKVGALGEIGLPKGFLVYVGSALGAGGVLRRVARHFSSTKTMRWHIDYITPSAAKPLLAVAICWPSRLETEVARRCSLLCTPVGRGFGSSDDRTVSSHLFYCGENENEVLETVCRCVEDLPGARTTLYPPGDRPGEDLCDRERG